MEERKNKFQVKERKIESSHLHLYNKNGGRPKKSEEEKRSEKVIILLTKLEKTRLESKAKEVGIPLGIYARKKVLE